MAETDRPMSERVSVLDRPPRDGDSPTVSRMFDHRVDPSSFRLALVDDDRRVYIGRGPDDELSLLFVNSRGGGGGSTSLRSTLTQLGAIVIWGSGWGGATGRPSKSRFVVTGIVADIVIAVRVGDVPATLQNNAFAALMPRGAADVVTVTTSDGERQVRRPRLGL